MERKETVFDYNSKADSRIAIYFFQYEECHASTSLSRCIISHHVTSHRNVNHMLRNCWFLQIGSLLLSPCFFTSYILRLEKILLALDPLSTRRGFIRSSRFETRAVYKLSTLVVAERKDECSMPVRSRIHPVLFDGPTVVPTDPFRSIPWNLIVNRPPLSP